MAHDFGLSNAFELLKNMDVNGDGAVGEDDFVAVANRIGLGSLGETAMRSAFQQVDKNKNGKVDFSEVLGLYKKMMALMKTSQQQPAQ